MHRVKCSMRWKNISLYTKKENCMNDGKSYRKEENFSFWILQLCELFMLWKFINLLCVFFIIKPQWRSLFPIIFIKIDDMLEKLKKFQIRDIFYKQKKKSKDENLCMHAKVNNSIFQKLVASVNPNWTVLYILRAGCLTLFPKYIGFQFNSKLRLRSF